MVQEAAPTVSGHDWYGNNVVQEGCWRIANAFMYSTKNPILRGDTIKAQSGRAPNLGAEEEDY